MEETNINVRDVHPGRKPTLEAVAASNFHMIPSLTMYISTTYSLRMYIFVEALKCTFLPHPSLTMCFLWPDNFAICFVFCCILTF